MSEKLFNDFPEISAKEWKQKIQVDLKGADYETLLFHSNEGIDIKPFYHQENLVSPTVSNSPTEWKIAERFILTGDESIFSTIQDSLHKGAEQLWLIITSPEVNFLKLFEDINFQKASVYLEFIAFPPKELNLLPIAKLIEEKELNVSIGFDPIGKLSKTGNWFVNQNDDFKAIEETLTYTKNRFKSVISISSEVYQNAGATSTQQLAYGMAHVNEYLNFLSENFPAEAKNFKPTFKVALGSNYFFEIAKLKALRNLYASLASAYNMPEEINILTFPTRRNKTLYDYNVNMLRTTTECMSGILGGADWVCNFAYDEIYHHDNTFGRRIARNQLLILKHESYFGKVSNTADGSYYIETLTQQLSEKALEIFKSIEQGGGFITELMEGTIQRKIKESAQKEQQQFENGELTLVGTNKYINEEDKMKQDIEVNPFLAQHKHKTLIAPILQKRLAEKSEEQRLETEK